ncbi:NADH dehydrogenase 1 alpha subcomplex subunit 9 [Heterostelium album PN500]|uniref:NADH dehydrogenase 1 alpha subcomplex subunit 9 n=1 Tax=Heterostelium pallidum (strain ATCC 26659 / Pp 5 / PN500) TaxID=670386 RepID=D3BP95_HETP5|nr:NADH dehydrogenase 1 alpha subcomplex subunit 9 [Heterostelium album PN500]EFA77105.1 NADH dehydrogenase 1 alpha subcomplex subunit 9 [Heterostelium album PN500]|eukprot:XP_020429234.1 NADH dehydrogenase 1 alpha subcomplex subunit 9 [Heterostelium album PN500]
MFKTLSKTLLTVPNVAKYQTIAIKRKANQSDYIDTIRNIGSIVHASRTHSSGLVATVFGVTGFTGRYIVQLLTKSGIQVVVPYRGEDYSFRDLKVLGELGQIIPVRYDIRDQDSIERAMSHSNIVINMISRNYETRNFSFEDVNIDAATKIAKLSKSLDIEKYVHVSALNASEESASKWSRTKAVGEKAVKEILPNCTIVRPSIMFGDEDRLINKWSRVVAFSPFIPRYNEDLKFQPLHCVDFANAMMSILELQSAAGKTYELGGDEIFAWGQFLDMITEATVQQDKRNIPVSFEAMRFATKFLEYMRDPVFLADELEYLNQDLLVSADALTLKDLKIKPTPIQEKLIRLSRMFRPSRYFNAIANPQNK